MFVIIFPVVFNIIVYAAENEKISGYFSSYLLNSDYMDSISKHLSNNKSLPQLSNSNPKQTIDPSLAIHYLSKESNATDNKLLASGAANYNQVNKLANYDYSMLMNSNAFLPGAITELSNYYTYIDPKARNSDDANKMFSNNFLLNLNSLVKDMPSQLNPSQVSIDTMDSSTKFVPLEEIKQSVNKFLEDYGMKQLSDAYNAINKTITPNKLSDIVINQRREDLTNAFNKYNLLSALNKYESGRTNISCQ